MATSTAGSGLHINFTYQQDPSTLPTGFVAALNYAAQQVESIVTSPVNVDISVFYGNTAPSNALGVSQTPLQEFSYSEVHNALANVDPTAAASLPATGPSPNGNIWLSNFEAAALGLTDPIYTAGNIGVIGFNSSMTYAYDPSERAAPGAYDFIGVAEHEITEVMGRVDYFGNEGISNQGNVYSLLDMFHYTAPGTPTYTGTAYNYFSEDGGNTAGLPFNTNTSDDLGDWSQNISGDSFGFGSPDMVNNFSQYDAQVMNALGFTLAPGGVRYLDLAANTAQAIQGGPAFFVESAVPQIADASSPTLASATVQITDANGNPVAGDALFVNGAQNGSAGDGVTASWNGSTDTLTLTGSATLSAYANLLGLVTYQDAGSDASTGSHPVRTLTVTINDGTYTTTETQHVTIDRAPVETPVAATANVTVGASVSAASLFNPATDADGDTITSYVVSDSNPSAGQWEVNGAAVSGTIPAAQFSQLTYAGLSNGVDHATLQAYDGTALSAAASDSVTVTVGSGGGGGGSEAAIFSTIASFGGAAGKLGGNSQEANLTLDSAGNLYGIATFGGGAAHPAGTAYEIVNNDGTYAGTPTVLADFDNTRPANGGLVIDSTGDILGTTSGGGANYDGSIFEIPKGAGGPEAPMTLFSFGPSDPSLGSTVTGGLVADAAGNLFGMTDLGGTNGDGTAFELARTADGYAASPTAIANFDYPLEGNNRGGPIQERPQGTLAIDAAGNLFGTVSSGNGAGFGAVFEIAHTGGAYASTETTLYSFTSGDPAGDFPQGFLAVDANGDLFGTTTTTVFEIAKTNGVYASAPTALASFASGGAAGTNPNSYLVIDAAGDIFGSTSSGGANGHGTVFEIAKTDTGYSAPSVVYNFQSASGILGPVADAAGNLFGINGVPSADGTIFELSHTGFVTSGGNGGGSGGGGTTGETLTANDTPGQVLTGTPNDDTFYAGHSSVVMTGEGGADHFIFQYEPWSAGSITDFTPGTDQIDVSALLSAAGYTGSNPVADGLLSFQSDGSGDTQVLFHDPANAWPTLVTTLDGVAPSSITPADYGYGSSSGGGGGTQGVTLTADDSAGQHLTGTPNDDTFFAGHNSVVMTGNGGADTFVFQYEPWNAGSITDFTPSNDKLDLSALLSAAGYTGSDPVADGYVTFQSDGQGDTQVYFNPHSASQEWPSLITTLDGVSPTGLTAANTLGTSGSGSGGGGGGGGGGTTGETLTANDTAGQQLTGTPNDDIFYAGHNSVVMTGNGGADQFIFQYQPWNAGSITDFNTGDDVLNLKGIFASIGYTGSDPVADGHLVFQSDGSGDTQVIVNPQGPGTQIPITVTTLDHVDPSTIHASDYIFA